MTDPRPPAALSEGLWWTRERREMFDVMLAAQPTSIDGLPKATLGQWCENIVAAGYRLAAIRAETPASREPLDVNVLGNAVGLFVRLPKAFGSYRELAEAIAERYAALDRSAE